MNNGMKTTEEEDQQNEIKLAYERNGMEKQIKNIQNGSKNTCNPTKDTTLQKTCNYCIECKCTVYISMF